MATIRMAKWGVTAAVLSTACGGTEGGVSGTEEDVRRESSALTLTATRALVITNTGVTRDAGRTEDPCSTTAGDENKVWSIGHLLKREAEKTGNTPSDYVSGWMNSWIAGNPSLNGQVVPPLLGPHVRDVWQRFAGGSTSMPLHKAPFWLLAIVSRLDLRKHRPTGEPLGGEVRFVFGFLAANANNPPCPTTSSDAVSTIIFEYSANKSNENDVRDFARRWLELTNATSDADHRNKLASLTEEVVNSGKLLRIRTNEGPTSNKEGGGEDDWDLGEFEPHPTTKLMQRSTIKQSPTEALAGGTSAAQPMSDWIWANRSALLANASELEVAETGSNAVVKPPIGSYWVPNQFPSPNNTTWFRGSINTIGSTFWSGSPGPTGLTTQTLWDWVDARFRFSIGTCKGCHAGETNTAFLHIAPGNPGSPANLSAFLSGPVAVADPEWGSGLVRNFDEMKRRENDLRALVNQEPVLLPVLGNYYQIRFRASGKCLDSEGNTTADGAPSKIYTCHGNANQRLALVPAPGQSSSNVYNVKYKHSGKCLDVKDASTAFGAVVEQRTCDSSRASQRFSLETRTGTPHTRLLRFRHSGKHLVPQSGNADGTAVVQTGPPVSGFDLVE